MPRAIRQAWFATAAPALAMALGGCSLGPSPESVSDPGIAFPEAWSEQAPAEAAYDLARYWQALDDPLLGELVEAALANNLDLAQSSARLVQAREGLAQARAGYFPQLGADGRATRGIGENVGDDVAFNVGLNASWEVDLFGSVSSSVAAARFDYESAGYDLADLQRAIAGQVAQEVINARSTALRLAIARDTLANQNENFQIARWRNQAGLASFLDVEQARNQRAQTAASIPLLESSLAATSNAISTLIGEPPGRVHQLLAAPTDIPEPPVVGNFGAPADLLRRRPDVRSAEARLLSDTARIGIARAQMFPLLVLTGNISTTDVGPLSLFDLVAGTVMASVNQLLFDGGRTAAQIASAEALADGSLAGWRKAILVALEETETAIASRRSAEARLGDLAEALDAANNAAILARSQYQAGLTDFETLLIAEGQLLSARNAMVSAQADRAAAFVRLTQALGGGWTIEDEAPRADDGNRP